MSDATSATSATSAHAEERWSAWRTMFVWATKTETALQRSVWGRVFLLLCALSSPVDFALDVRMAFALVALHERTFAALLFVFAFLSLRLQLLLFFATTARPFVEGVRKKERRRRGGGGTIVTSVFARCLEWPVVPEFTVRAATLAWLPFGLHVVKRGGVAALLFEVVYAPVVLVVGPFIILYGSLYSALTVLAESGGQHFYRLDGTEQVRRVRSIIISAVSTSFQAIPQLVIQATVYAVGTVQLDRAGRRIVIASMTFSVLSLVRSVTTLMASYHKILFTLKRVNRDLDETTFNVILHECGDLATSGESVRMRFDSKDSDDQDLPPSGSGHSLLNLRELCLEPADPADPFNVSFRFSGASSSSQDDDPCSSFKAAESPVRGVRSSSAHSKKKDDNDDESGVPSDDDERGGGEDDFVDIVIDEPAADERPVGGGERKQNDDDDDDVLEL